MNFIIISVKNLFNINTRLQFRQCISPRIVYAITPYQHRYFVLNNYKLKKKDNEDKTQITEFDSSKKSFAELTPSEKVKQTTKDATYGLVVIGGILVTGLMFYAIGRELFSGQSPNGLYSKAFKLCKNNLQVLDTFGTPLKGYGEENSRGRRRFVRHSYYELEGVLHMLVMFHIEGPHNKATVHVDAKQDKNKKYQFDYIIVELEAYPHRTITILDNRPIAI